MSDSPLPHPVKGVRRVAYISLGYFFVGLALLGLLLPVLPCTPFLLPASYFFARSSPRLNRWLLRSRVFGPLLRDWQQHRGVRRHVKYTALAVIPVVITASAALGNLPWYLTVLLVLLGAIGLTVVLRLRVVDDPVPDCPPLPEPPEEVAQTQHHTSPRRHGGHGGNTEKGGRELNHR